MREYLPILILGGIIGLFTVVFLIVYAAEKNKKETMGFDRHMADSEIIRRLMVYAKPHWKMFLLGIPGQIAILLWFRLFRTPKEETNG